MTYVRATAVACVFCAIAVLLLVTPGVACVMAYLDAMLTQKTSLPVVLICIASGGAVYGLIRVLFPRVEQGLEKLISTSTRPLQQWTEKAAKSELFAAIIVLSATTLFLELVLIRWQGSLFPVFALYKNFTLLACFCGLGIGYSMSHRKQMFLPATLPLLSATLAVLTALRYTGIGGVQDLLFFVPVHEETSVFTGSEAPDLLSRVFYDVPVYFLLIGVFILNVLVMIPVAQYCGYVMTRVTTLAGYGCNLMGSIAGVVLLFLLSWLWIGPVVWFGICAALLLLYQLPLQEARRTALACAVACLVVTGWPVDPMTQDIYSPYQLIQKATKHDGLMEILSAGSFYQEVYDLSKTNGNRDDKDMQKIVGYYELPFRAAGSLGHVAIVGAGSGNDAAAALRSGAGQVNAVEIDPAILALGRANHPEHPYDDARVRVVNDDARTFFRNTRDSFDAVVYGVLDSHILLSHGSNVRLDSFVYTREGLTEAFNHLNPGGLMSVSFALPNDLMGRKIYRMLHDMQGAGPPVAVFIGRDMKNITTFMVQKVGKVKLPSGFVTGHGLTDTTATYAKNLSETLDLPVDDWPFFYMDAHMYPTSYVVALVLVMALAFGLVRCFLPEQRWNKSLLPFFFLGSGFMLVETKVITELGLLFGNTWHVIGITIIGVLIMAFLANVVVTRVTVKVIAAPFALLLCAIGLGYAVAVHGGLSDASLLTKLEMVVLLTSPLLFSGIVFSTLLKKTADLPSALAYNLMGAMLGGLLEYNSMEFGFAFLYLLALGLYGCAWLTSERK